MSQFTGEFFKHVNNGWALGAVAVYVLAYMALKYNRGNDTPLAKRVAILTAGLTITVFVLLLTSMLTGRLQLVGAESKQVLDGGQGPARDIRVGTNGPAEGGIQEPKPTPRVSELVFPVGDGNPIPPTPGLVLTGGDAGLGIEAHETTGPVRVGKYLAFPVRFTNFAKRAGEVLAIRLENPDAAGAGILASKEFYASDRLKRGARTIRYFVIGTYGSDGRLTPGSWSKARLAWNASWVAADTASVQAQ